MAIKAGVQGQFNRGGQQSAQVMRYPAPLQGIDARVTLSQQSLNHCVYAYNLLPTESDMRVRKGYREWQVDAETAPDMGTGIHTIIPFDGIEEQGANDRLFAVTNEGIWDVTVAGDAPILKIAFTDTNEFAGYGVFTHYVGNNEQDVLFYADNFNGLFSYDALTDTWAVATGIVGPVISNIRFIAMHKQRLWLIEENSTKAWYLPVGSIAGDAVEFFFGSKFRHGGNLEGVFNWSIDGGAGVDDMFVAVSRAGDVIVYQGDDPSTADTWSVKGTYYIGNIPKGPFFGTETGGELFLLSSHGLTGMNSLLQGVDTEGFGDKSPSTKIAAILRKRMSKDIDKYGWAVRTVPSDGAILISTPLGTDERPIQFYYNIAIQGWSFIRDLPVETFASWRSNIVFGDPDNRILYMDVTRDNLKLAPPEGEVNGSPIEFSILTSFHDYGAPAVFKRVSMIRPDFVSAVAPTFYTQARYDYNLEESATPPIPKPLPTAKWDISLWDKAIWGSDSTQAFSKAYGGWGIGRNVAVATKGFTYDKTSIVGWDTIYTTGGPLL